MKLLLLSIVFATSFVLAQQAPVQKDNDSKALQRSMILLRDPLPTGQAEPIKVDIAYTADKVQRDGPVVKLSGSVKLIRRDVFVLLAEAAEYHEDTGLIVTEGPARIIPMVAPPAEK